MEKDPAFLLYSKDWIEGTAEYMPDEKGVYIDLLCHQHQKGSLPTDTVRLARMVGLSHEAFLKIWSVISCHFIQKDERLYNQKLENVRNSRAEKSKMNTITGTFAGLLRLGKYSQEQYKHLKNNFKPTDFTQYEKEQLTERLTEWIQLCLKSIAIANAIAIEDNIENIIKEKKKKSKERREESASPLKNEFDAFRVAYPGTKRGLDVEFEYFKKVTKNWKEIVPILKPKLQYQINARKLRESKKLFVPEWKNLSTWINNKCWEEELVIQGNAGFSDGPKQYTYNEILKMVNENGPDVWKSYQAIKIPGKEQKVWMHINDIKESKLIKETV